MESKITKSHFIHFKGKSININTVSCIFQGKIQKAIFYNKQKLKKLLLLSSSWFLKANVGNGRVNLNAD